MLEKELKIMLSEEEYDRLIRRLRPEKTVRQVNHYYFSRACSEKRISVRVREVDGRALLQIKLPVSDSGALAVREEIEHELGCVPEEIDSELLKRLCGIGDTAVRIGSLATERALSYIFDGVELCLDRNEYLGCVDHELEAEYTGEYPEEVIALLKDEGIATEAPAKGKFTRFLERAQQRKTEKSAKAIEKS